MYITIDKIAEFLTSKSRVCLTINGPWGIGKTHLWKQVEEKINTDKKVVYIDLFGKESYKQILEEIVFKLYGTYNSIIEKASNIASKLIEKVSCEFIKIEPNAVFSIAKKDDFNNIIVCFDNIERKSDNLSLKEILGLVNLLKEDKECSVVLILNKNELNKQFSAQALKKYYELKKANNSVSIHHHKDTITIRYFPDIYASAGFGNTNENENFQIINVDKTFLTEVLGVPYKTQYDMIKIYGESMEPFIQNDSFIIIDTTKNSLDKIRNADVVIFRDNDNELFCKRILKNAFDDDIVISSDNFNFGDKKVKKSTLKDYVFVGVVVCSCNAKIFLNQIERV
ncbi:S24/S26 family peptidase [Campylobacter jejuni]|uniref:S24/S26 family peptidase n=2 Tax=Campylobacter jejuni TaxID=197 RepID=UPI0009AAABA2|nr:S24/S26 family peptidase [Campylobacter jejuni]EAL0242114.1 S24 family peptidase [Campylobacter jejuni]EAL2421923.1 S24 family peptidase [Campylobacter jejuni]ECL2826907.1 S24 family peptidase [Campylobacter jejuni]ECL9474029.1 S24 family peptidase [Campylobacter jejuni]EFP2894983.1 S24 family peptidase [Campylobacter jejuni]